MNPSQDLSNKAGRTQQPGSNSEAKANEVLRNPAHDELTGHASMCGSSSASLSVASSTNIVVGDLGVILTHHIRLQQMGAGGDFIGEVKEHLTFRF